jgi:rSAM/selenodomain-associated transferase 2
MGREPKISILIPAFNEERSLPLALAPIPKTSMFEVIVVDGGSIDRTTEIASRWGAKVVHSPPGRAVQMNRGASLAKSDILLFLHSDTILPLGFEKGVVEASNERGFAAGAFRLSFAERQCGAMRFVAWTANWRARYLRLPYGDQAIFLRRETFWDAGGYPNIPIMEDVALIREVRKRGKIVILPQYVKTSARRYEDDGILRRIFINKLAILGFTFGVSPHVVARLYEKKGKSIP